MMAFEICPKCSQIRKLSPDKLKPMVLSGDDSEMQCDVCNSSFPVPDCESIIELARQQRCRRYADPFCHRCNGEGRIEGTGMASGEIMTCPCVSDRLIRKARDIYRRRRNENL